MFDKVQESLKRSKDERQKKRLERNGFVLRKPQQKQLVRKSGFNRRLKRYRLKKNAFSPLMTRG